MAGSARFGRNDLSEKRALVRAANSAMASRRAVCGKREDDGRLQD